MSLAFALVQTLVTFATIAQGTDSRIGEPREVVVRTADEWQRVWETHAAPPMPSVDFSRTIVVGVFLGVRPTAGYTVEIIDVETRAGTTEVAYVERRPPPGAFALQVLTAPYHLVSLPRDAGTIEFRQVERRGEPEDTR